jgi:hypothetical protein
MTRSTRQHDYSLDSARRAAEKDDLAAWVAEFLASPGSDNAPLGAKLTDPPRSWTGPLRLPIRELARLAGPSDHPVLEPVDEDEWRDDVDDLAEKVDEGFDPPPVIVTYRNGQLVLEDGNHRVEALRRAGEDEAWAVVSFEDHAERDDFLASRG